jgi:hypothetical protein
MGRHPPARSEINSDVSIVTVTSREWPDREGYYLASSANCSGRGSRTTGRLTAVLGAAVPEAPVHEDGDVARWQDEVGGASLGDLPVQPEPPAGRVDRLAQ